MSDTTTQSHATAPMQPFLDRIAQLERELVAANERADKAVETPLCEGVDYVVEVEE